MLGARVAIAPERPPREKCAVTQEDARLMRQELDALAAAITTKLRHLEERGLLDEETRALAAHLQGGLPPNASELEGADKGTRPLHSRSLIAKEIDALGQRFRSWLARTDRKYQTHARHGESRR